MKQEIIKLKPLLKQEIIAIVLTILVYSIAHAITNNYVFIIGTISMIAVLIGVILHSTPALAIITALAIKPILPIILILDIILILLGASTFNDKIKTKYSYIIISLLLEAGIIYGLIQIVNKII